MSTSSPTALITGAGGALASALIAQCQAANYQLVLLDYSAEGVERLRQDYPQALVKQVDLRDEAATQQCVQQVLEHVPYIDAVFNIAGGFGMKSALELNSAAIDEQLSLNFKTAVHITQALLPSMQQRGEGFILAVAAGPARQGGAKMAAYASSKAALVAYMQSLRAELAGQGLAISIVYPMGALDTPGNRASMPGSDPAQWIDPQALAESMLHLANRPARGRVPELLVYPPA